MWPFKQRRSLKISAEAAARLAENGIDAETAIAARIDSECSAALELASRGKDDPRVAKLLAKLEREPRGTVRFWRLAERAAKLSGYAFPKGSPRDTGWVSDLAARTRASQ